MVHCFTQAYCPGNSNIPPSTTAFQKSSDVLPARVAPSPLLIRQCITTVGSSTLRRMRQADPGSFMVQFFLLTYITNRPCIYCSALLLILFASSCYWSDRCLFDTHAGWFAPQHSYTTNWSEKEVCTDEGSFLADAVNETVSTLVGVAIEETKRKMSIQPAEWTGAGVGWMRSWLGARQWRLPCVDVYVRL